MIKARAPKNVPLPEIISSLQLWRSNPSIREQKFETKLNEEQQNNLKTLSDAERIEALEKQVADLLNRVQSLEAKSQKF